MSQQIVLGFFNRNIFRFRLYYKIVMENPKGYIMSDWKCRLKDFSWKKIFAHFKAFLKSKIEKLEYMIGTIRLIKDDPNWVILINAVGDTIYPSKMFKMRPTNLHIFAFQYIQVMTLNINLGFSGFSRRTSVYTCTRSS